METISDNGGDKSAIQPKPNDSLRSSYQRPSPRITPQFPTSALIACISESAPESLQTVWTDLGQRMKTLCITTGLILSMGSLQAAEGYRNSRVEEFEERLRYVSSMEVTTMQFLDPVRSYKGARVDIFKLWLWEDNVRDVILPPNAVRPEVLPNPMPDWRRISGKVIQAKAEDGILLLWSRGDEVVFIKNYPNAVVDNSSLVLYAIEDGTKEYLSTGGAIKVVRSFNYGLPANSAQWKDAIAEWRQQEANQRRVIEDAASAKAKAKAEREAKIAEAVRRFREEQAKQAPQP